MTNYFFGVEKSLYVSQSCLTTGRDEKGCLLSTEKNAAVDVDSKFHDQLYNNKYFKMNLDIMNFFFVFQNFKVLLTSPTALFSVNISHPALFYLVDMSMCRRPSMSILQPFSSRPWFHHDKELLIKCTKFGLENMQV